MHTGHGVLNCKDDNGTKHQMLLLHTGHGVLTKLVRASTATRSWRAGLHLQAARHFSQSWRAQRLRERPSRMAYPCSHSAAGALLPGAREAASENLSKQSR